MSTQPQRTCPSCGNEFSETLEFCQVCMLRKGLAGGIESGESSSGETLRSPPDQPAQRFDHYELVTGEHGRPVELGCGAMGVTYKAFDINLRCPMTLKVINERYLGDESARLRFLREARAAASVRQSVCSTSRSVHKRRMHLATNSGCRFAALPRGATCRYFAGMQCVRYQTRRGSGRRRHFARRGLSASPARAHPLETIT
ncbi:MAG TPA: hypothetical protein VK670_09125 [Silvibacterium sp.]|nr:hypothetical protein [Silvibacterium sp.]